MGLSDQIIAVFTIIFSFLLVILLIAFSWWFIYKVFLSRFEFINEIFFPESDKAVAERRKGGAKKKPRKE
jgi:hypothetical protein